MDKLILWSVTISLLIFILYPIVMVISTRFYSKGIFTLANYKNLINPRNLKLIKNSIFVVTLSSFIGVIISVSISLFAFMGKWKSKIYKGMLLAMILTPFVSSIALVTLFGRRGLIT